MSRKALGKGIDALLFGGSEEPQKRESQTTLSVPIQKVHPNPRQPRKEFKEESLHELAESIKEKGILQPILVEEKEAGEYIIVAGERRYRASLIAGLKELPVIIKNLTDEEKIEIALIENIQREDLTPIEEAMAYRELIENGPFNQEGLAKRLGKDRSTIANSLRLLKLPDDMQKALSKAEITAGHARAILSLVNPADQEILFSKIMKEGLSVREAERLASELQKGLRRADRQEKKANQTKNLSVELIEIEQKLIERLGTKVSIKGTKDNGKIEVSYYSMEDLERIVDLVISKRD